MFRNSLAAVCLLVALPSAALAEDGPSALEEASLTRAVQIETVLEGTMPADQVFSPEFLAAVPADQLAALGQQLIFANGPIETIDDFSYKGDGASAFDLVFEKARASATLQLIGTAPYLVSGFRIGAVTPIDDTPQKILGEIAALPGNTGFGVYMLTDEGPQSLLTNKGYQQLAIGSAFKLYVLSALAQQVKAGKRHWSDVATLDAHSLPSGQMQGWPLGSPVTLQTLATMMISISDNTATDTLIRLLGRDAVDAEVKAAGHADPARTLPVLTTAEMFALKSGDPARIAAWKAADSEGRRALLKEWAPTLDAAHTDLSRLVGTGPNAIDSVEWFASAEDLARLYQRLRDTGDKTVLDILAINTALPPAEHGRWAYAGYKGGSETGVIALSWLLRDGQGRWFAVTASWNDPAKAVDDKAFLALAHRLIGMLHQ